jgi:class 3 adenylate cyclase
MKSERYRRFDRRSNLILIGANVSGALIVTFYFQLQATTFQPFADAPAWIVPAYVLGFVLLFILGNAIGSRILGPMERWYRQATAGETPALDLQIQRQALNLPLVSAATNWALWVVAGVYFGILEALATSAGDWRLGSFLQTFLGNSFIAGPVTAVVVYFAIERIWRPEIPLFFAEGRLSDTPAFRLTVGRRLLVLFVMGTLPLLLMAVTAYNYAAEIAAAPQPAELLPVLLRLEWFIVAIGVLMVVALALTLGHNLTEPLEELCQKMIDVQGGDLEGQMAVTSNDELGILAEGFNAMVDGLQREGVIRRLFGHYVTPQVAEHAIEHGADLSAGEYCQATVIFTDVRGFTALTERMGPEALIALLNRYFRTISAVVVEHGGLVTRLGGDSLLAVFGTPLNPAEDHAHRAVQAAWGLMPALTAFNQAQVRHGEPTVRIGVGVATGPVLAGNVGSEERLEYTVLGDAVNLASRLEAMTKELEAKILLSEATARAVEAWAPLQPIGRVSVRGKQEAVQVYALQEA